MKKLNALLWVGFLFFVSVGRSEIQTVKYRSKDLNLNFDFPINWSHPISFSGFNAQNKEYKLEVTTTKKGKDMAQISYDLFLGGKKASGGSIIIQKGNPAKISEVTDGIDKSTVSFEANITD